MNKIVQKSKLFMDTVVDIKVVTSLSAPEVESVIEQAFDSFRKVEQACSRFTKDSELMLACKRVGTPVQISPWLFEPLKFALKMAAWTNGMFDPTIGKTMESFGFNRHYLTGETLSTIAEDGATYRDIVLLESDRSLHLSKPMVIDLGAVAKGFAIDVAARALSHFQGFVINAGGDLYAGGVNELGDAWRVDIQHPVHKERIIETIVVTNEAVCTSGSYERRSKINDDVHHIIHPLSKQSPHDVISCSIVAPYAMMADVFSTVICLFGMDQGKQQMNEVGLKGILISSKLQVERVGGI